MKKVLLIAVSCAVVLFMLPAAASAASMSNLKDCSFSLSSKAITVNIGKSRQLNVTYSPVKPAAVISSSYTNSYGTWRSSDQNIASVSATGKIKALSAGSCTVSYRLNGVKKAS